MYTVLEKTSAHTDDKLGCLSSGFFHNLNVPLMKGEQHIKLDFQTQLCHNRWYLNRNLEKYKTLTVVDKIHKYFENFCR